MKNSEFITGAVPITKEEVRALALNKLRLKGKKRMVDVGAGTGTVGIEAALSYEDLEVISIECKQAALELTARNIERFGLANIKLISGYAPIPLEEKVDAIFIGGTGGKLEDIMKWSYDILEEGGRIVANFIIVDTFYETLKFMEKVGFKEIEAIQVGVSKLEPLGKGKYLKPENPIFIIEGTKLA